MHSAKHDAVAVLQGVKSTCLFAIVALCSLAIASNASADQVSNSLQGPALGVVLDETALAALPKHVFPDGTGLPAGSGNTEQGAELFAQNCAGCHGSQGQGGSALELVGDRSLLSTDYPDKGIGVFWPYAPTLFEYIQRAMPPDKPYSLSDSDVYAVIARVLELNGLVAAGQSVDADFLVSLEMPNRDGFRSNYSLD